ncbi:hypothetical protein MRB53_020882 [Persea americana]|uniref:Uncharacterized protein n=1 Tax=Persea americana TaxID=3435 RepID=A0ACC2L2U7_PERAE|nr:hypothetical protein MRB53_020882 [Persea americana]
MARMRLARKRAPMPVESGEGPSGDLGGVPSGRLEDVPEFGLAGEPEAEQIAARPGKRHKKQRTKEDPHLADERKAGKVITLGLSCIASRHHLSSNLWSNNRDSSLNFSLYLLLG